MKGCKKTGPWGEETETVREETGTGGKGIVETGGDETGKGCKKTGPCGEETKTEARKQGREAGSGTGTGAVLRIRIRIQ